MILSDKGIKKAISDGSIIVESSNELFIGPSSIDLHLAPYIKTIQKSSNISLNFRMILDTRDKDSVEYDEDNFDKLGYIDIFPNDFFLLSTVEKIGLGNNIAAFVNGRSSLARLGLSIHMAGFVDPGFTGTITLEVSNFTNRPIRLYKDIEFVK